MKEKQTRYIPVQDDKNVKQASGFRCAWDGEYLYERHHIHEYCFNGSNKSTNLILLCPNCHSKYHKGEITREELEKRRVELSGQVDRSSGNLSISGNPLFLVGGSRFIRTRNIVMFNGKTLLKAEVENNYLLITAQLYSKDGKLCCWMSKNRWWVENQDEFEFTFSKNNFDVINNNDGAYLNIKIEKDIISLQGKLFITGIPLTFNNDGHHFGESLNHGLKIKASSIKSGYCTYFFKTPDYHYYRKEIPHIMYTVS